MTHETSLRRGIVLLLIVCAGAGAHSKEPDSYLRAPLAQAWQPDSALTAGAPADEANARWWRSFDDPVLDSLVAIGERNNYNLAIASRRIEMSRQALRQTRSLYYPQIDIALGWSRTRDSGLLYGRHGEASTMSYFHGGATMQWEIDVFGKIHAQVKQGKAQVKVSAAEYSAAMVALDAEIASSYITLLVERAQLEVAMRHSENQKHILDITETRYRTGLVS